MNLEPQFHCYDGKLVNYDSRMPQCKQQPQYNRLETCHTDTDLATSAAALLAGENSWGGNINVGYSVITRDPASETDQAITGEENEEESRIAMEVIKAFTTIERPATHIQTFNNRIQPNASDGNSTKSRYHMEWNLPKTVHYPASSKVESGYEFRGRTNGIPSRDENIRPRCFSATQRSFHFKENNSRQHALTQNNEVAFYPHDVLWNGRDSISLSTGESVSCLVTSSQHQTKLLAQQNRIGKAPVTSTPADITAENKITYFFTSDATPIQNGSESSSWIQNQLKLNYRTTAVDYTTHLSNGNDPFCEIDKSVLSTGVSVLPQGEDDSLDNSADPFPDIEPSIGVLHPSYDVVDAITSQWSECHSDTPSDMLHASSGHKYPETTAASGSVTSSTQDEINAGNVRFRRRSAIRYPCKTVKPKPKRTKLERKRHTRKEHCHKIKKIPRRKQDDALERGPGSSDPTGHQLPPCRICGDKASGIHFGVNSCEACNEFFRRTLKHGKVYRCAKAKNCDVSGSRRNVCTYCRYQRCVDAGMSRNRIKTGRYSRTKKTMDALEIQKMQSAKQYHGEAGEKESIIQTLQELFDEFRYLEVDFEDDVLARKQLNFYRAYRARKRLGGVVKCSCLETADQPTSGSERNSISSPPTANEDHKDHEDRDRAGRTRGFDDTQNESVIRNTSEMATNKKGTRSGVTAGSKDGRPTQTEFCRRVVIKSGNAKEFIRVSMQQWEQWIIDFIRLVKQIPGFGSLVLADQMVLLKTSICQWYILNDYKGYDSALQVTTKTSGCSYHYEEFVRLFGEGYVYQVFKIAEKLKKLKLSRPVVMLMKVIAITSPDLVQLEDRPGVEALHWLYVTCLLHELSKPASDARGSTSQVSSGLQRKMFTDIVEVLVQIRNLVYEYNKDSFPSTSSKEKILYSQSVLYRELCVSSPKTPQHTHWTHCVLDS